MTEAAPSRLLTREREELDAIAESIREGRRIVAFLVCAPEMRAEVVAYLSGVSGRVVPPPAAVTEPEGMLGLLTEAAEAGVGDVRSVGVDPGREEAVRALNWHREKLRKGASLLVWIPDVAGLRVVRRLAPDAFSFRDILVAVKGEKAELVVPANAEQHIDVRLARTAYEAAGSRLEKLRAAATLAGELRTRDAPGVALGVLREALETVSAPESIDEEEALAVADVHWNASATLLNDDQIVEGWRHGMAARSILEDRSGPHVPDMRHQLAVVGASPMGWSQREVLDALAQTGPNTTPEWTLSMLQFAAAWSHAERGDARRASALLQQASGWLSADPLDLALLRKTQAEVASRAGRLDEAERLLAEAGSLWSAKGAGNEDGIRVLAQQRRLAGEIPAAQRLLAQVAETGYAQWAFEARRDLQSIAVESGTVHDGLAGLQALLHEAAAARRDGALYRTASAYTDCVVDAHEAERLPPKDRAGALMALRKAQEVAISISGDDPPWYHALFPLLRGRVLSFSPAHVAEAIDMTRAALDLCERSYTDATPMAARTLATHLVKAGRFEEALSTIERVTPQLVQERFLEELARVRALKIVCLLHGKAPTPHITATLADLRATFDEMDAPRIAADTLLELALLLPPDSPSPDTLSLLEEAHEMFAEMRIVAREARCLEAIGDVLFARGDPREASRRHLTAKEILERTGLLLRVPLLEKKLATDRS